MLIVHRTDLKKNSLMTNMAVVTINRTNVQTFYWPIHIQISIKLTDFMYLTSRNVLVQTKG